MESGILKATKDGRILCPFCGKSLRLRVDDKTYATGLGVFCRQCHHEITISINSGQRFYSQRPDV